MYSENLQELLDAVEMNGNEEEQKACVVVLQKAMESFITYKQLRDTVEVNEVLGVKGDEDLKNQYEMAKLEAEAALLVIDMVGAGYLGREMFEEKNKDKVIFGLVNEIEQMVA